MDTETLSTAAQSAMEMSVGVVSTWGIRVLGAIVVLIAGRMVAAWARRSVRAGLERAKTDPSLIPFLASMVYYAILAVVLIAVLSLFGIETTSLIAVLGAAGLAVGLALQGTLSNFAAGVMLLIFRPIRVGDSVEVAGQVGTVSEISVFSTLIDSPDNVRITIPNSQVFGSTIKNYSINDIRRIDLTVGVSYDDDISRALEIVKGILAADDRTLSSPESQVAVFELADSSVNLVVRPWCAKDDYWALRWDLIRAIKEGLEAAGCSIPYPQADLHVLESPENQDGEVRVQ